MQAMRYTDPTFVSHYSTDRQVAAMHRQRQGEEDDCQHVNLDLNKGELKLLRTSLGQKVVYGWNTCYLFAPPLLSAFTYMVIEYSQNPNEAALI